MSSDRKYDRLTTITTNWTSSSINSNPFKWHKESKKHYYELGEAKVDSGQRSSENIMVPHIGSGKLFFITTIKTAGIKDRRKQMKCLWILQKSGYDYFRNLTRGDRIRLYEKCKPGNCFGIFSISRVETVH